MCERTIDSSKPKDSHECEVLGSCARTLFSKLRMRGCLASQQGQPRHLDSSNQSVLYKETAVQVYVEALKATPCMEQVDRYSREVSGATRVWEAEAYRVASSIGSSLDLPFSK